MNENFCFDFTFVSNKWIFHLFVFVSLDSVVLVPELYPEAFFYIQPQKLKTNEGSLENVDKCRKKPISKIVSQNDWSDLIFLM